MISRVRGFVFHKNDINDSDRIFSVFTYEFGRIEIFGKAIRKMHSKLRSGIDVLCLSEIEFFQGRNKKTLTDAKIVKKFNAVYYDVEKFQIISKITQYLKEAIQGSQKDETLFFLIQEIFEKLESEALNPKGKNILFEYFIWNLMNIQGKRPHIESCMLCKGKLDPDPIYFSMKEGGALCQKCVGNDKDAKKINSDIIKILRLIIKKDWDVLSKLTFELSSKKLLEEVSLMTMQNFIHE